MRPVLFYTIGLPGAGKTTFARSLSTWLHAEHLRGDKIGLELFRFPTFSAQERATVYGEMGRRAGEHLQQNRHVLFDAAMNTHAQRNQLAQLAAKHGGMAIGILLDTPLLLAKKRAGVVRDTGIVGAVARVVPPHIFDQYAAVFEPPAEDESVIVISGSAPFSLQYRRLRRQLGANAALPSIVT